MSYYPHPDFVFRGDDNTKLWRYMDFTKFASLLLDNAIFLPSLRTLRSTDPFEGRATFKELNMDYDYWRKTFIPLGMPDMDEPSFIKMREGWKNTKSMDENMMDACYISCWHQNDFESDAMWKIYSMRGDGIAIQTTFGRLKLATKDEPQSLFIGHINYENMENHVYAGTRSWGYQRVLRKSLSYTHEQEVRMATIMDPRKTKPGIPIAFDLHVGIEKVITSPTALGWLTPLIKKLQDSLGLKLDVEPSRYLTPTA